MGHRGLRVGQYAQPTKPYCVGGVESDIDYQKTYMTFLDLVGNFILREATFFRLGSM